jgi:nondiscriminating glutamyl-tRNA synthetase
MGRGSEPLYCAAMPSPVVTRFAPSPTGRLHLGNVRTAFFNWLEARRHGGRFLLRLEDTDRARSEEAHEAAIFEDLAWLGLDYDAGPGREDRFGPYRQSERTRQYAAAFARLEAEASAYPCYCTSEQLELERKRQAAAGQPPRYAGSCRELSHAERVARAAQGLRPTLRFKVPAGRTVSYADLVRGPQSFASETLGDFVIRRADGSASFLFSNAFDDAAMAVTEVLRGEDHVANTPRQLLLLEALGQSAPRYGHLPLLVGADGSPLAKRERAATVSDLRAAGYLPDAIRNLMFRLGHATPDSGWLEAGEMPGKFALEHLGRAPARFDPTQLRHWQKEAVRHASTVELESWVAGYVPPEAQAAVISAVRANVVLPEDAREWAGILYAPLPPAPAEVRAAIVAGGAETYRAALAAYRDGADWAKLLAAVTAATGHEGRRLYRPLRAALTHRLDGPELGPLLAIMPRELAESRFIAAEQAAGAAR